MRRMDQSIRLGSRLLRLNPPLLMAIINVTPDSFYASSRAQDAGAIRSALQQAVTEGADIIDIGACSTRPAVQSSAEQLADEQLEWERLVMALQVIRQSGVQVPISVDTFRPGIAQRAIEEYGVDLINDVSGGSEPMLDVVAKYNVCYVLMYNRSHDLHKTDNILCDALGFFSRKVDELHRRGVSDVIVDPGFGFGQTVQESLELLTNLRTLQHVGCPILAGVSRKRMAYEPQGLTPETCLEQTLRLERLAVEQGATVLRVHDVGVTRAIIRTMQTVNG